MLVLVRAITQRRGPAAPRKRLEVADGIYVLRCQPGESRLLGFEVFRQVRYGELRLF